jgi:hypothetical protein
VHFPSLPMFFEQHERLFGVLVSGTLSGCCPASLHLKHATAQ